MSGEGQDGRRRRRSEAFAGRRLLLGIAVPALLAAACGGSASTRWARPQMIVLDWHENCGTRANPLPIATRRLTVRGRRWRVDISFRNDTGVTLKIIRPHVPGETLFGLEPFDTASRREVVERAEASAAKPRTLADRYAPSTPKILYPGDAWSGSFSGLGRLPAGKPIRVVLGRFVITEAVPPGFFDGFLCISARAVRLS